MSLFAPLAVPVEIRAETRAETRESDRRVFRLSRNVAQSGLTLERPVPFEVGQPVTVGFTLPGTGGTATSLALRAVVALTDDDGEGEAGGRAIEFSSPLREERDAIARYVAERLGLPGAPARQ